MKLSKEEIKAIIPHRDPMLLVDTVEEMEAGDHIVTTFFVDPAREIFKGHFPGEPVLPGVYSVECMAQTADILLLSAERYAGKIPLFLGINNVRFLKKILPGDTIEIHAKMASERVEKAIATCSAEVYNHGELAVTGDVTLAAIASKETAALYGLAVLAEDVNTSESNTTRFIVIGREMAAAGNRFSLLFTVDHRAGRLARVMQLIGAMGFNLECIKSRPMPNVPWEYYFYVEVVGDLSAEKSKELLDTLSGVCRTVRVLGVYDRQAAR